LESGERRMDTDNYPNVRMLQKDIGQIVRHSTYSADYARLVERIGILGYANPIDVIRKWNYGCFGSLSETLWNRRIGLY